MRRSIYHTFPTARPMTAAWLLGISLLLTFSAAIYAEERALPTEKHEYALLLSSLPGTSTGGSLFTASLADPAFAGLEITLEPLFLQYAKEKRSSSEDSFVLLHKRMTSRYAYNSWANLQTGYGELFPGDTIGRSRTNGVGIEDPHCLYFKMSLRF